MKKILFAGIILLSIAISSCGSGEKKVYQCPMKCEGDKTYDAPGKCPVCQMDLVEVKK